MFSPVLSDSTSDPLNPSRIMSSLTPPSTIDSELRYLSDMDAREEELRKLNEEIGRFYGRALVLNAATAPIRR